MITIPNHDVKIFTDHLEESARLQLEQLLSIPVFAQKKIRIMPDVHAGAGCVIGFTGDLGEKVIPNIVGVDIGCGMRVLQLDLKANPIDAIDFHAFHQHILSHVPSGQAIRLEKYGFPPLNAKAMEIYAQARQKVLQLHCYRDLKRSERIHKAIGSLGGGNHFIELNRDEAGHLYLVIHTGSRNLGKQVADFYQQMAIQNMTFGIDLESKIRETIAHYKADGRLQEIQPTIKRLRKEYLTAEPPIPRALCYLEGEARERYLHDMRLCQQWAILNRRLIVMLLLPFFKEAEVVEEFESVHNYISDDNIIRKGAISAAEGERCIIPLNMRDGSLLCTGKGNPDWNTSAPHGAGRVMSRGQAFKTLDLNEFADAMRDVYSECISMDTIDESPMVYKPADEIIAHIGDTVRIDTRIYPIFNFKAAE